MEKTRTLFRLRKLKNAVLLNLFTLSLGVILFSGIMLFEKSITSVIRSKATGLLSVGYKDNISNAMDSCDKALGLLNTGSLITVLFSLEGFVMIFFYIRLSSKTDRFSTLSPLISGLGTLFLFVYFLLLGVLLPASGNLSSVQSDYRLLKIIGVILFLFSNVMFIYQLFIQVVLEKVED